MKAFLIGEIGILQPTKYEMEVINHVRNTGSVSRENNWRESDYAYVSIVLAAAFLTALAILKIVGWEKFK